MVLDARMLDANSVPTIDRLSFLKSSRNPAWCSSVGKRDDSADGLCNHTLPPPRHQRADPEALLYSGDCSHRRKCSTSILSVIQLVEKEALNRPNGSDRPRSSLRSMCSTSKNGQGLFYTRHRARRPLDLLSNKFWNNGYAL